MRDPERRQSEEPQHHHRPEEAADEVGAEALHGEEGGDDPDADREDVVLQPGGAHLQALDRREHGDRRRDQAVAEEERGPDHPEDHDEAEAFTRRRHDVMDQKTIEMTP